MADAMVKSPFRWLWRALWALGTLFALLALVAAVALVMLKGSYGAAWVRDLADDRAVGGYGVLEVGRIRGDVLGRFRIERVAVRDEQGVWLEARDIEVAWSPLALAGRVIDVELAAAEHVEILRRPIQAESDAPAAESSRFDLMRWRLFLEEARIGELELAEGVAGPAATLSAQARLTQQTGAWSGAASVQRVDVPGDQLALDFVFDQGLEASFEFAAAPDGVFADLIGVPGSALSAQGRVAGDFASGEGQAQLSVDADEAARLDADWSEGRLQLSGSSDLSAVPGLAGAARRVSGPVAMQAVIPFSGAGRPEFDFANAVLDLSSGALSATLRPGPERTLDLTADLGEGALALLSSNQLTAGSARIEGRLDLTQDRAFQGRVSGEAVTAPGGLSMDRLAGDVALEGPLDAPSARWDLQIDGFSLGVETIDALIGDTADLAGALVWRREAGRITLSDLALQSAAGDLTGSGSVDLAGRGWAINAGSEALRPGDLTSLVSGAGAVTAQAEGGFDGAVEAELSFAGFTPAGALQARLTAPLSGEARLVRAANGDLSAPSLSLTSPEAEVQASASRVEETWRVDGDAVWSGAAPVSALTLDGALTARFDASAGPDGLQARVEARARSLRVGPEPIAEPRLRVALSGQPEALSGTLRLTGEGGRGPLDLEADFARRGDAVEMSDLSGRAAGFTVQGSALAGPEALSMSARLAPEAGFGRLQLDAALESGVFDVTARAEDLVFADLSYLDAADFTLQGPLEDAAIRFNAEGAYGAPFDVSGQGRLVLAEDASRASATFDGAYGVVAISTRAPLEISIAPQAGISADLSLGQGRGVFEITGGQAPRLSARLVDAPAALLSLRRAREPVEGALSGEAELSREGGFWSGEAELRGVDLRPARSAPERTLSGGVRARLDEDGLAVSADASGSDLTASADLNLLSGPVSDLAGLAAAGTALDGSARADGRIGDFAAFHIDPAQRLSGDVTARVEISGTVSDPVAVGEARLSQGGFSDARAGLNLRALEADLNLTRDGARLTRLSAEDGRGGTLSGTGRLDIATPLSLETDIEFQRFRVVDRDELEATATGAVRFVLEEGEGALSGSAVVDRADLSPTGRGRASIDQIEVTEINRPGGLDPAPERGSGPPIRLDYQVSAPRRFFVRGPNYDTEWSFDLSITGTASDPELLGEARLVRGRADLLGRSFDLERGVVILDGDPSRARIDVAAVNRRQDVTARVEIDGRVNDPDLRLTSEPALPEDEVASRILFGESAGNLTALQAAQLAGALASLSGGSGLDPLGALRNAAGLDVLGVQRDASGDTVVSGGRYLTDDVFLQLESAGLGAGPTTRIEWTLTPRFTLSSRLDSKGRAGLALTWRFEYEDNPFEETSLFSGFAERLGLADADRDGQAEAGSRDAGGARE